MKILTVLVAIILSLNAYSKALSLNDLKKMAQEKHYGLKSREVDFSVAIANEGVAKSKFYPKFGVQAGNEWIKSKGISESDKLLSVYGQLNILNGLRDVRSLDKSKIKSKLMESQFDYYKFNLGQLIESKYYEFLFIRKKLKINSEEILRVKSHKSLVERRYKSKLITKTDFLEFQLNFKKLKSVNNYLKLEKDQLLSEISSIIGVDTIHNVSIEGELPHLHVKITSESLLKGIDEAPSLRQFKLNEDIAEVERKIASSGWIPSIDLRAEYGRLDEVETGISSDLTSSRVAVIATWELFSGFETSRKINSSRLQKSSISYAKKQAQKDYTVLVTKSFRILKMLEQTIDFEEENEKLTRKLYKNTLKDYKKGVRDSGALGSASEALASAQNRIFELKYNFIKTKLDLEKIIGKKIKFDSIIHKGRE